MTCGVFSNSIIATVISFPEITEPVFKLDTQGRFMLYGGILIYAAIVVLIGWWASRRVNNMSDFLVAGRRLPLWMASATLLATWFGAGPSMAATGAVFEKGGLKNIIADPFAAAISLILAGIFIVGILRRNRLLTVTEIVEKKFGVAAGVYTSIWMIPVYVGWLSAQVLGMGKLLQLVLGVSTPIGTLIGAGIVLLYTIAGGMWAVTITDVVQVALIIVGLLIIVPGAVNGVGGFGELFANISPEELSLLPEGGQDFNYYVIYIGNWMIMGLGCMVGQDLIQRSLASKNEQVAVSSSLIAGFAYLMLAIVPLTIGFAGRIIFPNFSIEHAEYVLPMVAQSMLSPVFFTIFLSALIAAIMSSADSSLLACSSLIVNNIIKPFSQERNQQKQLILTRWITCIIWGCSTLLALYAESIYTLMTNCWASQLVIVFIPVVAALYLKRSTKRSCWICMTASTVVWIGYVIIAGHLDEDTFTIGAVYGFATGIVAFLASHLSEKISRTGNIGSLIVGVLFGAFFEFIALVTDKMLPRLSFWAILTGAAAYGITLIFTYWGERLLNYYVHHEASETQHFRSNNNRDEYKPARRRSRRNYYDKNA